MVAAAAPCTSMRPAPQFSMLRRLASMLSHAPPPPALHSSPHLAAAATPSRRLYASAAAPSTPQPPPDLDEDFEAVEDDDFEPSYAAPAAAPSRFSEAATTAPAPPPPRTGAFQKLPMVSPSKEIIESAVRRSARVGGNNKLKNEGAKAKNRAARQLDSLMKELAAPLGSYERGFPPPRRLHPFENALLELTVGPDSYSKALARVTALRKAVVEVAKGYAARASKAANKREAVALQAEGFERVEAVYGKGASAVDDLKELAKSLRRLPVVDPLLPTVALVGAPNVGKSSLVQLLSSGLPEIQNYPFTTRSIKMGHFYVDGRRHQVTDTPGLLNRPEEDRNAMERLTLASLQHLPTAVLFVADLTGDCGTTVANQWAIRQELKQRFPDKLWVDVLSKADMLEEEFDAADERRRGGSALEGSEAVATAVEYAAAVPAAARVSSLTGDGVDELKTAMLKMLASAAAVEETPAAAAVGVDEVEVECEDECPLVF